MFKRLCSGVLILIFIFMSVVASFGASDKSDRKLIYDADTKPTKPFLVTITRPDGNESTFKKSYVLCGVSEEEKAEDIVIKLLIYDKESEKYIEFKNADDESSWNLGKYGIFIKEILLPEGENKIRIAAYNKSDADNLVLGKTLQLNNFTITVLNEDIKVKLMNGFQKITNFLKDIFSF